MILLIDNYDSFTYNIYQFLCELTAEEVRVIRSDEITVDGIRSLAPSRLILSPGPGRPEEAGVTIPAIQAFAGQLPILGVCLGHQAIGHAFGGRIIVAQAIIHGKTQDIRHDGRGVFRGLASPTTFTRYHSLVIERSTLPDCLEVSATSPDGEIMGVRHKEFDIEGVQFHPESIASEGGRQLLRNFLNYRREAYPFRAHLHAVLQRRDLSRAQAREFMTELTDGNLSPVHLASLLTALNAKGVAATEIAGCAEVLKAKKTPLPGAFEGLADTCGTGGDDLGSFNISSMAALIAVSCGLKVAKHGNRAVSSKSGSADFYAELGLTIDLPPAQASALLAETGFTFLFAPLYHGAMKHAAQVRKELGIKTLMNCLGPLVNPASASHQVIGVYDPSLGPVMAEAAAMLGAKRALIVHSDDGMDEISVCAPTAFFEYLSAEEGVRSTRFDPQELGLPAYSLDELNGGSARENAVLAQELLDGRGRAALRDASCVNAGAALWVGGLAPDLAAGYKMARKALDSGAVKTKVAEIIESGQRLAKTGAGR